jgi:hypothetical protein
MFDPITLGVGGALALAGWVTGRQTRRTQTSVTPEVAVCSCTHGYGIHEEGKKCAAQIERPHYWSNGSRNGHEWVPCPCLSYDGPEPLPRVWTGSGLS